MNDLVRSQALQQPRLAESLASVLRDGRHGPGDPYAVWLPPRGGTFGDDEMRAALAELEGKLSSASEDDIRHCLARLALVKPTAQGSAAEWEARASEYIRLMGNYPADIWSTGCDTAATSCKFFPDPSELAEIMSPLFHDRMTQIQRLKRMMAMPPAPPPEPPIGETERARVGRLLANLKSMLKGEMGDPREMTHGQYYDAVYQGEMGEAHKREMLDRLNARDERLVRERQTREEEFVRNGG